MRDQGVLYVKRFSTRKNSRTKPTNTYLFSFSTPNPPTSLKAGYCSLKVDTFIPNPLRCFKCQRYGHGVTTCTRPVTCAHCGEQTHTTDDCDNEFKKCTNCLENHPSYSKDCPIWKQQMEINRLKFSRNISFSDARKLVQSQESTGTYASIVQTTPEITPKVKTSSIDCQTDLTWLNSDAPQMYSNEQSTKTSDSISDIPTQDKSSLSKNPALKQKMPQTNVEQNKSKPESSKGRRSDRISKGSDNPIHLYNKFGYLERMDVTENIQPRVHSVSPSKSVRGRSPIIPPKR